MPASATIGILRLRSRDRPGVAERLRLESRLARAELQPPSLPPSAILIVRSISSHAAVDGTTDWRELRQQLESLHRRAARPGRQPDLSAPAVVFANEAELAAWFAMDVVDHVVAEHWWWRHAGLRSGLSPATQLVVYLDEHPRCVPEAMQLLAEFGSLVAVARLFSAAQSATVLRAVVRAFELELPAPAHLMAEEGDRTLDMAPSGATSPPWRAWLPVAQLDNLPTETQLLVALGLGLVRAPQVVRSAGFAREAALWVQTQRLSAIVRPTIEDRPQPAASPERADDATALDGGPDDKLVRVIRPGSISEAPIAAHADRPQPGPAEPQPSQRSVPPESPVASQWPHASPTPVDDRSETVPSTIAPDAARAALPTRAGTPALDRSRPTLSPVTAAADPDAFVAPAEPDAFVAPDASRLPAFDAAGVQTSLAGAFFLINVLLRLEGRDRSKTAEIVEAMGPWAALEMVVRRLLASLPEATSSWDAWESDPLWAQLAVLDGRPQTQRLGDGVLRGRKLARLVPALRNRLASAVDTDPDGAIRLVVLRSGRLYVSGTHVDVVMALDDVSGQVRRAGLDIDPGWQPRYQRVIKFHYR